MGYDLHRFQGEIDEELICPICSGVVEEPVQSAMCEHMFCRECIKEWLTRQPSCPMDRNYLTVASLNKVPRIMRILLSRLSITCNNAADGCTLIIKLGDLNSHVRQCEYNPNRLLPCEKGCGIIMPKDMLKDHNCVRDLRAIILEQKRKIYTFKKEIVGQTLIMKGLKLERKLLIDFIRATRDSNPNNFPNQMECDEVIRWCKTMARARVIRWRRMISTSDVSLRMRIKRALSNSGYPPRVFDNFMGDYIDFKLPWLGWGIGKIIVVFIII
uniref:E3 ubiquitin-protein ligase NRDP1 n=1 Tax=Glossina brevipalpis TaxID=37001 RepID=A0A1A9WVT8_9MUSC